MTVSVLNLINPLQPSAAKRVLEQSDIPALRQLQVEENDSEIVVEGTVTSFYLKQLAQEALMPALGNRRLLNRVRVNRK